MALLVVNWCYIFFNLLNQGRVTPDYLRTISATFFLYFVGYGILAACRVYRCYASILFKNEILTWAIYGFYVLNMIYLITAASLNAAFYENVIARAFLRLNVPPVDFAASIRTINNIATIYIRILNFLGDVFFVYKLKFTVKQLNESTGVTTNAKGSAKRQADALGFTLTEEIFYLNLPTALNIVYLILYAQDPTDPLSVYLGTSVPMIDLLCFVKYSNAMMERMFSARSSATTTGSPGGQLKTEMSEGKGKSVMNGARTQA